MYFTFITAVALFAAPVLAEFAINSPELTQCGTHKISWEKTEGPYNLIVVDAADPCGEPLVEIGDFEGSSVQWKAILPAGKIVQLSVADKNDDEAWSRNITVGASSDSSCLSTTAAATTNTDSTTTASDGTTTPGSTPGASTGGSSPGGSTFGSTDSDGGVVPVGAANAGTNNALNGALNNAAPAARSLQAPALVLSAIAAIAALAL